MKDYPHPENPGQTHYEGCWKRPRHHNCAVARVYELEEELKQARKQGMLEAADEIEEICLVLSCTRNAHGMLTDYRNIPAERKKSYEM